MWILDLKKVRRRWRNVKIRNNSKIYGFRGFQLLHWASKRKKSSLNFPIDCRNERENPRKMGKMSSGREKWKLVCQSVLRCSLEQNWIFTFLTNWSDKLKYFFQTNGPKYCSKNPVIFFSLEDSLFLNRNALVNKKFLNG